jgi:hypothetical protein
MPAETVSTQPGAMSGMLQQLQGWAAENPRLLKSLMAGLGMAAVGGGLTAMSKRENESRAERRKRILRNALGAGAAGAGAVGLGDYALGQINTVDPSPQDPVLGPIRDLATAVGGGTGLLAARGVGRAQQTASRGDIISGIANRFGEISEDNKNRAKAQAKDPRMPGPRAYTSEEKAMRGIIGNTGEAESKGIKRLFAGGDSGKFDRLTAVTGRGRKGKTPFENMASASGVSKDKLREAGYVRQSQGKGDRLRYLKDIGTRELDKTIGRTAGQRLRRVGGIGASAAIPYSLVSMLMQDPELAQNTLGQFRKVDPKSLADVVGME